MRKIGYDPAALATVDEFLNLDVRVGTVVAAEVLRGARKPAFSLQVDFGPLGKRVSTAQITELYEAAELVGLQVIAVVNLPPRRVAGVDSEALVLAVADGKGESVLLIPERPVPDGGKVS
jgi:tRNA-binding protein